VAGERSRRNPPPIPHTAPIPDTPFIPHTSRPFAYPNRPPTPPSAYPQPIRHLTTRHPARPASQTHGQIGRPKRRDTSTGSSYASRIPSPTRPKRTHRDPPHLPATKHRGHSTITPPSRLQSPARPTTTDLGEPTSTHAPNSTTCGTPPGNDTDLDKYPSTHGHNPPRSPRSARDSDGAPTDAAAEPHKNATKREPRLAPAPTPARCDRTVHIPATPARGDAACAGRWRSSRGVRRPAHRDAARARRRKAVRRGPRQCGAAHGSAARPTAVRRGAGRAGRRGAARRRTARRRTARRRTARRDAGRRDAAARARRRKAVRGGAARGRC
jgi:hypothetical protein